MQLEVVLFLVLLWTTPWKQPTMSLYVLSFDCLLISFTFSLEWCQMCHQFFLHRIDCLLLMYH